MKQERTVKQDWTARDIGLYELLKVKQVFSSLGYIYVCSESVKALYNTPHLFQKKVVCQYDGKTRYFINFFYWPIDYKRGTQTCSIEVDFSINEHHQLPKALDQRCVTMKMRLNVLHKTAEQSRKDPHNFITKLKIESLEDYAAEMYSRMHFVPDHLNNDS